MVRFYLGLRGPVLPPESRHRNDFLITYRRANLQEELAHGVPVVHGVERGDFVDSHRGHLQHPSHLVHDANAGEAMLALAKIKQRHHGGLLVLRGVSLDDLVDEGKVLRGEFEGDVRVVVGGVAMLKDISC